MVGLVNLVGIIVIITATFYLVKPDIMKKSIAFWAKDKRFYAGGILNLLVGIVFLIIAKECSMPLAVIILGILSILKGVIVLVLGSKIVPAVAGQFWKASVTTLRSFAVIALGVGILIIYAA